MLFGTQMQLYICTYPAPPLWTLVRHIDSRCWSSILPPLYPKLSYAVQLMCVGISTETKAWQLYTYFELPCSVTLFTQSSNTIRQSNKWHSTLLHVSIPKAFRTDHLQRVSSSSWFFTVHSTDMAQYNLPVSLQHVTHFLSLSLRWQRRCGPERNINGRLFLRVNFVSYWSILKAW